MLRINRLQSRALALAAILGLSACAGLKEAFTAHVDIAARAGSQELSVAKLAAMMSTGQVPARKDVAVAVSNLWVNYQLLGVAGARGDTLIDPKAVDDAMWAQIAQLKSKKLLESLDKPSDPATGEKRYADGEMLAARHILIMAAIGNPDPRAKNATPAERDSAKKLATSLSKQVNAANFAKMAEKHSADGSKSQGGSLGVFPRGQMVKEFEAGVMGLKQGEISGPIETQFGYHIIMRQPYAEVKDQFLQATAGLGRQTAESTLVANLEKGASIEVKPGAAKLVKAIAEDIDGHRDNREVVATSKKFSLDGGRLAKWIAAFPPQQRIREQIATAPDSVIPSFVKNVMRQELVLRAADSAKVTIDTADVNGMRRAFFGSVMKSMVGLGVAPAQLADSAKTPKDREALAASRINTFLDGLLENKVQFVDVSEPVALALRKKYEARVVTQGLDRAVADAVAARAKADSLAKQNLPSSSVPMPGAPAADAAPPAKADSSKPAAPKKP